MYLFCFKERGREGEREEGKYRCVRDTSTYINQLTLACPQPGTWLQPRHVPLTQNPTDDLLILRPVLNPLSHITQGCIVRFINNESPYYTPETNIMHSHYTLEDILVMEWWGTKQFLF